MAKIVLTIDDELLPANPEVLPGALSSDLKESAAVAAPAKREITIMTRSPSAAAASLAEPVSRPRARPEAPKVVLLLDHPADALDAVTHDADGVVISSPEVRRFLKCLGSVAGGRRWVDPDLRLLSLSTMSAQRLDRDCLTLRERQIVEGVVRGLRNKEIASAMGVRESTVKMHLHHIFEKLKIASRIQLALAYLSSADVDGKERKRRGST